MFLVASLFQLLGKISVQLLCRSKRLASVRGRGPCLPGRQPPPPHLPANCPGQQGLPMRNRKNFIEMKGDAHLYPIKLHINEKTSFSRPPSTHVVSDSFNILLVFLFLDVIELNQKFASITNQTLGEISRVQQCAGSMY